MPLRVRISAPVLRVPNLRRVVPTRGRDPRPVRAERNGIDAARVPLSVSSAPLLRVPDLRRVVGTSGHDPRSVRAERRRLDLLGVPLDGEDLGTALGVPHVRGTIAIPGDDPRSVRAEGRRMHGGFVSVEGEEQGTALRVPDLRRPVRTASDDPRPVGAERRRRELLGVPVEGEDRAPFFASQIFAVLSSLAVTTWDPSGLNDADAMTSVVPHEREDFSVSFRVPDRGFGPHAPCHDPRPIRAERRRIDGVRVP